MTRPRPPASRPIRLFSRGSASASADEDAQPGRGMRDDAVERLDLLRGQPQTVLLAPHIDGDDQRLAAVEQRARLRQHLRKHGDLERRRNCPTAGQRRSGCRAPRCAPCGRSRCRRGGSGSLPFAASAAGRSTQRRMPARSRLCRRGRAGAPRGKSRSRRTRAAASRPAASPARAAMTGAPRSPRSMPPNRFSCRLSRSSAARLAWRSSNSAAAKLCARFGLRQSKAPALTRLSNCRRLKLLVSSRAREIEQILERAVALALGDEIAPSPAPRPP